jgi:ketosteroid isomerase-like protein
VKVTLAADGKTSCTRQKEIKMEHPRFITYDYPEEKAAIREMLVELRLSLSSLDLERIESHHLYGPKFTRVQNGTRMGAEAGRQVERDFFGALARCDSQFEDVRIDVFEDTALVTCVYQVEAEASGQTNIGKMYLTFLLVNDGGQWKIIHEGIFDMPHR